MPEINPNTFQVLLDYLKTNNISPENMSAGIPNINSTSIDNTTHGMMDLAQQIQQVSQKTPYTNELLPETTIGQKNNGGGAMSFEEYARATGTPLEENGGERRFGRNAITNETRSFSSETPSASKTLKTTEQLISEGYTKEEAEQLQNSKNYALFQDGTTGTSPNYNASGDGDVGKSAFYDILRKGLPYASAAGTDLDTGAYDIGRYLGMEKGTRGKGLGVAASIGDFLLGSARGITSGIGFEKKNQYVEDWYRQNQNKRNYTPNSQTESTNSIGGFAYGGLIDKEEAEEDKTITFMYGGKKYQGIVSGKDKNMFK